MDVEPEEPSEEQLLELRRFAPQLSGAVLYVLGADEARREALLDTLRAFVPSAPLISAPDADFIASSAKISNQLVRGLLNLGGATSRFGPAAVVETLTTESADW